MHSWLLFLIHFLSSAQVAAQSMAQAANAQIYSQFCMESKRQLKEVAPRYENSEVLQAARKITESKKQADHKLKLKAEQIFVLENEHNINLLIGWRAKVQDRNLQKKIDTILQEISLSDANNWSSLALSMYDEIVREYDRFSLFMMREILEQLKSEMLGVDFTVLKQIAQSLQQSLPQDLKAPDLLELRELYSQIYFLLQRQIPRPDEGEIYLLSQKIFDQLQLTSPKKNYSQGLAQKLMKAIVQKVFSKNSWLVDELVIALSTEDLSKDPVLKQSFLRLQSIGEDLKHYPLLLQADDLAKVLIKGEKGNVRYLSQSLIREIKSVKKLFFKNKEVELLANFESRVVQFSFPNIIKNLDELLTALDAPSGTALYDPLSIAQSLAISLRKFSHYLSPTNQQLLQQMESELKKSKVEKVFKQAQTLILKLEKSPKNAILNLHSDLLIFLDSLASLKIPLSQVLQNKMQDFRGQLDLFEPLPLLTAAIQKSSPQQSEHFYFYPQISLIYGLSHNLPDSIAALGISREAHWFLTQLCGEFRDRASMIAAKVRWLNRLFILQERKAPSLSHKDWAHAQNVWEHVSVQFYKPYLNVSDDLWRARRQNLPGFLQIGEYDEIDYPVPGITVCETKFIFAEYVSKNKNFDDLQTFESRYMDFKKHCRADQGELTDYYDFRGDANFKHYTPESNGMIWYALSLGQGCRSMSRKNNSSKYSDQDCVNYFTKPFYYRYQAARAGLASWLFLAPKYRSLFAEQGTSVVIYSNTNPDLAPFGFSFDPAATTQPLFDFDPEWLGIPHAWNDNDIGFNIYSQLNNPNASPQFALEIIRDAVDRHTDWYNSGFDDKNGFFRRQAYSPFVASSYIMKASDNFSVCGTTINCPNDGLRRWMFIFRIKAQNWYTPLDLLQKKPIDFETMWFDETSFGESELANKEQAWDRLGTVMEEELDSILYLIHVDP